MPIGGELLHASLNYSSGRGDNVLKLILNVSFQSIMFYVDWKIEDFLRMEQCLSRNIRIKHCIRFQVKHLFLQIQIVNKIH